MMNYSGTRSSKFNFVNKLSGIRVNSGVIFGLIIFSALFAFEIFNYSTTDFALRDLLGNLKFAGIRWATILAIAFCGIDFAGIARLFNPNQESDEIKEVWYLFGAWLIAATINAALTWWGISMAITTHNVQSAAVIDHDLLYKVVPVFVAIMVWVIRILLIGSLSSAGQHLFNNQRKRVNLQRTQTINPSISSSLRTQTSSSTFSNPRKTNSHGTVTHRPNPTATRAEPTYQKMHATQNSPRSQRKDF